jgi:uncharacterized repeat protein (TIGR03809 family)
MTLRTDATRSRILLACWRELAEKRLEYLTELFESGRWRRYYSEFVFLENIKEAKIAVETWRTLSTPDHARNSIIDISWSAPERAAPLRRTPARAEPSAAEQPEMLVTADIPVAAKAARVSRDRAPAVSVMDLLALQRALDEAPEAAPDTGAVERHPLPRNPI